jgi:DNA-binding CsgD family transcriptional regulator
MPSDTFPPGLSIREQQVFRLVREGRMDSEIAVRIGVGTGEVKQTVGVLMSKCGVRDRAGLVAWEPDAPPAARRPWVERLADRMGATVGGLVFALIVVGIGGIYLWRAFSGDEEPVDLRDSVRTVTAPATPSVTSTPTATSTP